MRILELQTNLCEDYAKFYHHGEGPYLIGAIWFLLTLVLASQFYVYLLWVDARLAYCLNSVLNVKASRHFQPEEGPSGPSRGVLRDCETSHIIREPSFEAL